jgi:hypothetical protein
MAMVSERPAERWRRRWIVMEMGMLKQLGI